MKLANVGISILYPERNYINSIPTKAFEYMVCSLPIIMSDFPYWRQIFGDCALFVKPHDAKDVAEKILYLLEFPNSAKKLGERGRTLVKKNYNWDNEGKKLLSLYKSILSHLTV
ncbi:MAG: glycosyltransferase [Bacteroidetes bacterium]|nr:glycosyltransferase [Bacteroidota bacterium]